MNLNLLMKERIGKTMVPSLLPGDCINTASQSWISKMIRDFGKMRSGDAQYSHTAIALGGGMCVESLWRVRVSLMTKYDDQTIIVWRIPDDMILAANPGIDPLSVREAVAQQALLMAGDSYGLFKIPLFALDSVFRTYWFTQTFGLSSFKVCSQLFAYNWSKIGNIDFGVNWRSISPDYLDDWFSMNVKKPVYEQVSIQGA
jgi:hypothetical protein